MIKNLRFFFLPVLAVFVLLSAQVQANDVPEDVLKAEQYLNDMKKIRARFVMTSSEGTRSTGDFYLNRPGKLRFSFDPPIKDFIVADGRFIYFYDDELGEQSNAPIGTTLADFLLRDNISLSGDIAVTKILRAAGLVQISLTQKDDPAAGSLILGFDKDSFELQKWRVVDSLDNIIEVELLSIEKDPALDNALFYYRNPNKTQGTYNE